MKKFRIVLLSDHSYAVQINAGHWWSRWRGFVDNLYSEEAARKQLQAQEDAQQIYAVQCTRRVVLVLP